jgi:hypothetical protein
MRRVVAALLLLASACASDNAGEVEDRPLVVVLFDVSRSTRAPEVRERYLAAFGQVLDFAQANHASVVGDVIDENPLAHSTYPVDGVFEPCDAFSDNQLVCDGQAAGERDRLTTAAAALLEPVDRPAGTDVHGGVLVAARVFGAYPEAGDRYLVILSDMVERSSWREAPAPPDLTGVQVYVVGAGATGSRAPADILADQRAWQAFFTSAGADLPDDRYGAALVRFP